MAGGAAAGHRTLSARVPPMAADLLHCLGHFAGYDRDDRFYPESFEALKLTGVSSQSEHRNIEIGQLRNNRRVEARKVGVEHNRANIGRGGNSKQV